MVLSLFWTLLQKNFSSSPNAKAIWADTTGKIWLDNSEARWCSKHDVLELLAKYVGDFSSVVRQVLAKVITGVNS